MPLVLSLLLWYLFCTCISCPFLVSIYGEAHQIGLPFFAPMLLAKINLVCWSVSDLCHSLAWFPAVYSMLLMAF